MLKGSSLADLKDVPARTDKATDGVGLIILIQFSSIFFKKKCRLLSAGLGGPGWAGLGGQGRDELAMRSGPGVPGRVRPGRAGYGYMKVLGPGRRPRWPPLV